MKERKKKKNADQKLGWPLIRAQTLVTLLSFTVW
jgi:hypothetical protein